MAKNRDRYDLYFQILSILLDAGKQGQSLTRLEYVCSMSYKQSRILVSELSKLDLIAIEYNDLHRRLYITYKGRDLLIKLSVLRSFLIVDRIS